MIGEFATSIAGHDKNQLYIIIREENEYVYLADGHHKTIEHPKKKSHKHIQPIHHYSNEQLTAKIREHQLIYDEEIKRAIKLYKQVL
ncbi:MAG: KOW domain-containing RNA-binding protein [Lachnospiraceae bacterium]